MIYAYIKLSDNTFPVYEGDIRLEYPDIPQDVTGKLFPYPENYAPVLTSDLPIYDLETQDVMCTGAQFINNQWQTTWSVINLDLDAIAKAVKKMEESFSKINTKFSSQDLAQSGSAPNVIG